MNKSGFCVVVFSFSLGTLVSSTNKTDRHDITEILLKVAFKKEVYIITFKLLNRFK
jgi:hypothetical protein